LQATAEVLLQEAVDDLLDEAHARQEEYYKKHGVSSEDEEVRGRIWFRGDQAPRLELVYTIVSSEYLLLCLCVLSHAATLALMVWGESLCQEPLQ